MDASKNHEISPNFSTILSNLSINDALLFEKMCNTEGGTPSINFRLYKQNDGGIDQLRNILIFNNEIISNAQPELKALETFGLIELIKAELTSLESQALYNKFLNDDLYFELKELADFNNYDVKLIKHFFEVTDLGVKFASLTIL